MQVRRLSDELETARRRGLEAEARCDILRRQIAALEQRRPKPPGGTHPQVLLVDDQPRNLLALEEVLAVPGHETVSVGSGHEALKALLEPDDFAVIILDDADAGHGRIRNRRAHQTTLPHPRHPHRLPHRDGPGRRKLHPRLLRRRRRLHHQAFRPWALRAKVAVFIDIHLERRERGRAR